MGWVRQTAARVGLATVAAGVLGIALPTAASAHADFVSSDPSSGQVVAGAPRSVTLTFSEPVEVAPEAVKVYDDSLTELGKGNVASPVGHPDQLQLRLPAGLSAGTYVVVWQVAASDTHPVAGTFRFSIDAASTVKGTAPGLGRNDTAGFLLALLRWAGYAGLVLGPGLLVVCLLLWPETLADRRVRRLLGAGLGVLLVSTVGGMALQGVWAADRPLAALLNDPSSLDSHSRRFDQVYALRTYAVLAFAGVLWAVLWTASGRRRSVGALGAVVAAALALTWPLVGHASTGTWVALSVVVNLVHTGAMMLWLAGLVLVVVGLAGGVARFPQFLPRFSTLAFVAVSILVVTGTLMSWREVGSFAALTGTTYGKVLLVKLVLVVLLLALGNLARTRVRSPSVRPDAVDDSAGALRRGVGLELLLSAVVLSLTSALVVLVPAGQAITR